MHFTFSYNSLILLRFTQILYGSFYLFYLPVTKKANKTVKASIIDVIMPYLKIPSASAESKYSAVPRAYPLMKHLIYCS